VLREDTVEAAQSRDVLQERDRRPDVQTNTQTNSSSPAANQEREWGARGKTQKYPDECLGIFVFSI
jgi:hypothetical protein